MLNPPIQTIPQRGNYAKYVKEIFVPDDDYIFGCRDLSQSEVRIMGWIADDKNILNALKNKIDIHTKTAAIINKCNIKDVTKEMRQKAKAAVFGYLYGMSAEGFQEYARDDYSLNYTIEECRVMREDFFSKPNGYYSLPKYYKLIEKELRENKYIQSPLGRRRRLQDIDSDSQVKTSSAIRQAINFPIQSFSSDLALISMMLFWKDIKEQRLDIKPMFFIHDAIIFQCRENIYNKANDLLKECMEVKAPKYILDNFNLEVTYPIESDQKIGRSWNDL
jgi:DNA polymerase-1